MKRRRQGQPRRPERRPHTRPPVDRPSDDSRPTEVRPSPREERKRRQPPPLPQTMVVHPGDVIAKRYRVETIVSREGGMLVEARHELFGQPVSLRIVAPHQLEPKSAERFRRQARVVAELDSEHVARILDAGVLDDGSLYLAREHVAGDYLIDRARAAGGLELEEVVTIFVQVCEAVQEAHARGVVLRDLRPEHLVVTTKKSGEPLVKIVDLGACMVNRSGDVSNSCTQNELSPWASPEMVRQDDAIDARADVWSLGCLLYELLCGERPFRGRGPQLMLAITQDEVAATSSRRRNVPRALDTIVRWALAKDREGRPRSVHALVHSLWPFANMPSQLLIDRIARLASSTPVPIDRPPSSSCEPRKVMERASVRVTEETPPPSSGPKIPPPCPVPSMEALDPSDPFLHEAQRRRRGRRGLAAAGVVAASVGVAVIAAPDTHASEAGRRIEPATMEALPIIGEVAEPLIFEKAQPTHGILAIGAIEPAQFSVNGMHRGYGQMVEVELAAGAHNVTCTAADGTTRTKQALVIPGRKKVVLFR